MSNFLSQFAAGSAVPGGNWLTTKKRGQDDDAIRRDSAKAIAERKNARLRSTGRSKTKGKREDKPDEEDEDFIVDDEEEISENSSSGEELEIVNQPRAGTRKASLEIASSSEEGSEAESTFFPMTQRRTSRPPPAMLTGNARTNRKPPHRLRTTTPTAVAKTSKDSPLSLLSSDDEKQEYIRGVTQKRGERFTEEKKGDDSDNELRHTPELKSRFFPANAAPLSEATNRSISSQESPFLPACRTKKLASVLQDSDDEVPVDASESNVFPNDVADSLLYDSDEELGVRTAIERSLKEQKAGGKRLQRQGSKKNKKKQRRVRVTCDISDAEAEVLDVVDSSSGGEGEEQDGYEDEEAREAGSVLQTANQLSGQVLQAVSSWARNDDGTTLPKGIIVDGAVSIASWAGDSSRHSWISQKEMEAACPNVTLSEYQLLGVNWLALLNGLTCKVQGSQDRSSNVNGVLADEMGLGKTVQTIAFLAWLRYKRLGDKKNRDAPKSGNVVSLLDDDDSDGVQPTVSVPAYQVVDVNKKYGDSASHKPHLIIVPASVLSNWEIEFKKFCPEMNVFKYYGSIAERHTQQDELRKYLTGSFEPVSGLSLDVILTTMSYFSKEKSDDRAFLRKFNFDYMVVDEAHTLKNAKGARYKNLDRFKTSHRLLLTGTPVQNSPKELMALLCFLMPLFSSKGGPSGGWEDGKGNDGGESMLQHFVSLESSCTEAVSNDAAYRKLKQLFAPFVLRRRKDDVMHQILKPKTRKVELVPLDDNSRQVYDSLLARHIRKREASSVAAESYTEKQHLFSDLRKAANHPLLLRMRHKSEEDITYLAKYLYLYGHFGFDSTCTDKHVREELAKFSDFDIHVVALQLIEENPRRRDSLSRFILQEEDLYGSPKLTRLRSILPDLIADGHRILVFSQWRLCLDLLGCLMESLGIRFVRFDGETDVGSRQGLVDEFNQDCSIPVFLLSTRAGGMGINLTAADVCILHDLDFNPFNDEQAESRCHRIGQKKPVTVYKMVTQGTVDEDIYKMQQRKAEMNAAIFDSDSSEDASSSTTQEKGSERKEISSMLQSAVNRFLHSPQPAKKLKSTDGDAAKAS